MKTRWSALSLTQKTVMGLGVVVLLFKSYTFYIERARQINYRTFNIDNTVSWAETSQGIYRLSAKGLLDNLLLSSDEFRSVDFSFELLHARDCGLLLHYQDPQHYDFVYFHQPTQSILLAQKDGQETNIVKRLPLAYSPHLHCSLRVHEKKAVLALKDIRDIELPFAHKVGKIGILINDAQDPRTIFLNAKVQGILSNGQAISGRSPPTFEASGWGYLGSMLPFYMLMLAAALYLACLIGDFNNQPLGPRPRPFKINYLWASLIHLCLAVFIFAPFIFRGEILVASYDNIGEIFPLFFFSKHKFTHLLSEGGWPLWNPYFHNGTPFWSSHWNMLFDPLNWPIFLLPDSQVMFALTLRTFLQVFLTGVLAFGFFRHELGSPKWALLSSIAYQLCSFLIFSFTIFPTTSLYFSMTLYLYLLWSFASRRPLWNFTFMTLALYLLFVSANVVFVFYAVLVLIVVSVYRFVNGRPRSRTMIGVAVAGWLTALFMAGVRLLSCFWGIVHGNRIVDDFYTLHDRAFLLIRLFVPEIVGWFGADTLNALTSDKLELIFRQINLPSNSQNTFFVYFGIIPALLVFCSFLVRLKRPANFWKIYALVTIAIGLFWQPVWGIISILCFPLNHYSYHVIIIPIGICALIGHMGLYLEKEKVSMKKLGHKLWILLLLVQAYILTFLTYLFPPMTGFTRGVFIVSLLGYITYKILRGHVRGLSQRYLAGLQVLFNSLLWVLFFMASTVVLLKPFPQKEGLAQNLIVPFLGFVAIMTLAMSLYYFLWLKPKREPVIYGRLAVFVVLVLICSGFLFQSQLFMRLVQSPTAYRVYITDILLAQTKFFLIVYLGILAYILARLRLLRMSFVIGLLIFITAMDLVCFNLRFNNVSAPFYHNKAFYGSSFGYSDVPQTLRPKMDLINYRAHAQHRVGLNANKNIIFDIPSYTGTLGYLHNRFSKFITAFGYEPGTILIYPADIARHERFLDLSAVKYEFIDEKNIKERPRALARLNLFSGFEVIDQETPAGQHVVLQRLNDRDLNIHKTVILVQYPPISFPSKNNLAVHIPIEQSSDERIMAHVETDKRGIVLFNESYDAGWQGYVDGEPVGILRANYNFMAIPVEAGTHEIVFEYKPKVFFILFGVSMLTLVGFIVTISLIWVKGILSNKS